MTIKSFDDYFKEKGNRVYSDILDKDVYVDKENLERAKVIFEEFRTPKGVHLWHYNHYQGSKEEQKAVDEFDKKHFKYSLTGSELSDIEDAAFEYASYYEKEKAISEIKDKYNNIRDAEKLSEKRIETIMSNTAYVDYEMIRKDQKDTNERISYLKEKIEEKYKKVNPGLAALREEERNKVEAGINPQQAQKERREAVKAYYNKKTSREDR